MESHTLSKELEAQPVRDWTRQARVRQRKDLEALDQLNLTETQRAMVAEKFGWLDAAFDELDCIVSRAIHEPLPLG
jgi:hypothetical protein